MAGPVFATRWDFLLGTVVIGVDRSTGVFSGSEPTPGQQMVCVWSSDDVAAEALHVESWELRQIRVRDLVGLLPEGIGVVVDPERTSGMTASASYVANLRRYVKPFPAGSEVRLDDWDDLPAGVRDVLVTTVSDGDRVSEVFAFRYSVDDSPWLGCVAHAGGPGAGAGAQEVTAALEVALESSVAGGVAGVSSVEVLAADDLPDAVRAALGERQLVHRRPRERFWRRGPR